MMRHHELVARRSSLRIFEFDQRGHIDQLLAFISEGASND